MNHPKSMFQLSGFHYKGADSMGIVVGFKHGNRVEMYTLVLHAFWRRQSVDKSLSGFISAPKQFRRLFIPADSGALKGTCINCSTSLHYVFFLPRNLRTKPWPASCERRLGESISSEPDQCGVSGTILDSFFVFRAS